MALTSIPSNPVPANATDGMLKAADGVAVRFARWPAKEPRQGPRKGTICVFPGRAEMIEKYFEVIEELRGRGFAVAALDWRGQGGSARALADPRKGHVGHFEEYQRDLDVFMRDVVLPDCPPPYFALAHSMGGANTLRALHAGKRWFDRVVLCSPMIDLSIRRYRRLSRGFVLSMNAIGFGGRYIPGGDAVAITNRPFERNPVTSDPERYARGAAIVAAEPLLGLGSPTIGWLAAAVRVTEEFAEASYPASLHQPILIIAAGDDRLVSTAAAERFAIRLRAGANLIVPGARHEVLMEKDAMRAQFWAAFDAFVPGSA